MKALLFIDVFISFPSHFMYKHFFKRFFDLIIGIVAFPFVALLSLIILVLIKLDDGGPLFYMAERLGKNGRIFKMFKYRSMKVNSPDIRLADGNSFNSANDDRVTKVGKFLRKTSIDEIPQFLNVLLGQMSLIGPRPDDIIGMDLYPEKEIIATQVKPGITGWNQVINRNSASAIEKLDNDIYYVEHMSFLFDVKIIWLTIKNVLQQKNVYRKDEQIE